MTRRRPSPSPTYRERYHDVGLFENDVYDGIPELLAALGERGLALAVATSKPTYSATRILEHFGLARHFAFIGGADLEGVRHDKAAVIAHTMDELALLGLPCARRALVMVGDREHDVHGAPRRTASTRSACSGATATRTSCSVPGPSPSPRRRQNSRSCSATGQLR